MRPRLITFLACIMATVTSGCQVDQSAMLTEPFEPPELTTRERAFETMLTGAELIGHFTLDGEGDADGTPLREERYTITAVTRIGGNLWQIDCHMRYGDVDLTVPVPVRVAWAGDTPIIGVTDLMVPGLGRYTARVLFFRAKYAGTWSGKDYGGHLFGRIQRPEPADGDAAGE